MPSLVHALEGRDGHSATNGGAAGAVVVAQAPGQAAKSSIGGGGGGGGGGGSIGGGGGGFVSGGACGRLTPPEGVLKILIVSLKASLEASGCRPHRDDDVFLDSQIVIHR